MLGLDSVDLSELAEALEDHSEYGSWWFDPRTGKSEYWSDDRDDDEGDEPAERGLRHIEPISSGEGYADLEDFTGQVRDQRAHELLERAIAGRGAFRRFKDTLTEFPELRTEWFKFHDARMARRAIEWLREEGLIEESAAEAALASHAVPELSVLGPRADFDAALEKVADGLRAIYGERLRRLILFGSRARGDAQPDSDVDLLIVLDKIANRWDERRRLDELLGQRLLEDGLVFSAIPISEKELEHPLPPALIRAKIEGRVIA